MSSPAVPDTVVRVLRARLPVMVRHVANMRLDHADLKSKLDDLGKQLTLATEEVAAVTEWLNSNPNHVEP